MSRIFITASQDTSIYESLPNNNTGRDEILEVGKIDSFGTYYPIRSLITFPLDSIGSAPTSSVAILNLRTALATNLNTSPVVYVHAMSASWSEGVGYFYQTPFNDGVGATWRSSVTGSYWSTSGSDFYPNISASVAVTEADIRLDVSDIIQPMLQGTLTNYGVLLKLSDSDEDDPNVSSNLKYFSRNTHTVHGPVLELAWNNQQFITGSLKAIPSVDIEISARNLRPSYKKGTTTKLYFTVRDTYPVKKFNTEPQFSNVYYLPSGSIFGVKDSAANVYVTPMDQYSHVNCDTTGSYVILETNHMYKNRFYDLQLNVPFDDYNFYSKSFRFKIT